MPIPILSAMGINPNNVHNIQGVMNAGVMMIGAHGTEVIKSLLQETPFQGYSSPYVSRFHRKESL